MIVTVTLNPAVDYTLQIDELPASEAVVRTDASRLESGGKGINVSTYLDALGTETVATGLIGGVHGRYVKEDLDSAGIRNDFIEIDEPTRLNTTILTDSAEYKINQEGPIVDAAILNAVIGVIERHDPQVVLIAGSLPSGIDPPALDRIARAGSWTTAIDVDGHTLEAVTANYDLCKPNREELAAATGRTTETLADCFVAAQQLRESGTFETVVVSLGQEGAIMVTPERCMHAPALNADVVDTVGAGDALLAGILTELVEGRTEQDALRTGIDVASRVVAVPGTTVPTATLNERNPSRVSISVEW